MATAHINIGSNLGDRHALLRQAVAAIVSTFESNVVCSKPIESEPWGYESDNRFINLGLNIEIGEMSADLVMRQLKKIQDEIDNAPHRHKDGSYTDRRIDIDLIAIDSIVIDTPSLILPHPRMHLREFVLKPMIEIWPEWVHPLLTQTPAEMLKTISQ